MPQWKTKTKRAALDWYAYEYSLTIWQDVTVAAANWSGWPEDAYSHRLDALAVNGPAGVRAFVERDVEEAVREATVATPILAWSYADRPALGALAIGTAMLARSYPGTATLRAVALVEEGADKPNTKPAFDARGFLLQVVPSEALK